MIFFKQNNSDGVIKKEFIGCIPKYRTHKAYGIDTKECLVKLLVSTTSNYYNVPDHKEALTDDKYHAFITSVFSPCPVLYE